MIENPDSKDGLWYVSDKETIATMEIMFGIDESITLEVEEKTTTEDYKILEEIITVEFTKDDAYQTLYKEDFTLENVLYHPSISTLATGINGEKVLDPTIKMYSLTKWKLPTLILTRYIRLFQDYMKQMEL